jgi:membrane protease YdiL (CAAX protease family)
LSNPESSEEPVPEKIAPQPPLAVKLTRCPNCYNTFRSDKKFCPKCGRSRAELTAYVEQKREIQADQRAASLTWQRLRTMVWIYVMLMVFNFLAAYLLPTEKSLGLLGADSVIILLCIVWGCSSKGTLGGRFRIGSSPLLLLAVPILAAVTFGITVFNNNLAVTLLGLSKLLEQTRGIDRFIESPIPLAVRIVSIAVIPGIFEEIFFRGLVQGTLETALSKRDAWIVQAIVFAIAHINPIGFFTYLLLLGLYFGWLRNRTGSLIAGMIAHFSHNLICVLADHYHWRLMG